MENGDKSRSTEHGALGHVTNIQDHIMDISNYPSHINILKPQIDKIFSEVQKNLPSIDFDSSDISSDSDEPIFFHQNLKLSELSSVFDDDKDLDTSLSQGDDSLPGSLENLPQQINGRNKNRDENENEDNNEMYDNDLAAFLSKATSPTDDEIVNWQFLTKRMEEAEAEIEMREEADLKRSFNLGHISKASFVSSSKWACTASHSINEHTESKNMNSGNEETNFSNKNRVDVDPEDINLNVGTETNSENDKNDFSVTVEKFNQRLQNGISLMDTGVPVSFAKKTLSKDNEIISKFTLQEPATLSLKLFKELDLDSVLNAANEVSIPSNSLHLPGRASLVPKYHNGGGDKKTDAANAEELTLIQKLAQLSAQQSGADIKSINLLDPQTGAARAQAAGLISASSYNAETACQTRGVTTSCMGTSTDSVVSKARILYGHLKHEKRDYEPPTIFIDLRGFERQKEEERQGLKNVQRVLRINPSQIQNDSSSDDDDEMVERCNWRLTRQQIKQDLSAHGASSTVHHVVKQDKEPVAKLEYKKPPRVITLQEHAARKQSNTASNTISAVDSDRTKHDESDNKTTVEMLEMEREKERQMKEAMKQREQRMKEQEQRRRMSEYITEGRSVATTQGRQSTGENTPIVFDIEVSYEPAPTTLPSVLPSETLLLTVNLSSNGEICQHRNRSNRSVDTEEGISATYITLLSWLLSLAPQEFNHPGTSPSTCAQTIVTGSTFHVVGLQQLWMEEELRLYVVVTPSEAFYSETGRHSCPKKGKLKDEMKGSSKFVQHITKFLSVNTLYTVCPWLSTLVPVEVRSDWPEDKDAPPFSYSPPLPKISTKPLSTFVQVNPDYQAAKKIFSIPIGFYWQTVDNDEGWCNVECQDENINYETQNTVSLIYKKIFHNPVSLMAILSRVCQEGLDLAGIRLLYPSHELLKTQISHVAPASTNDILINLGPVLALALRGTFARTVWLDCVGPSDPQLARRTDPNSLCALFGGESRDNVLLFCPRNPSRVQSELTRWFGGRISKGASSVDIGVPYIKKEEGRGKRWKKTNTTIDPKYRPLLAKRPPATLTATCKSDIFLVLSPVVPASYFGVIMATSQRRGYQIQGIKRLLLTTKLTGSLGISKNMQPFFCPGVNLDEPCKDKPVEAIAPCTIFLLRKENAAHNIQSLTEAFMIQLTMAGMLGCVQMRVNESITSKHLFHVALYTHGLLALMGGNLSKVPEFDVSHLRPSSSIIQSSSKELEQIAVVILFGHDLLKKCGVFVAKILNVLPYSKTPVQAVMTERFELLGLKWVSSLTMHQAKELTPYEVGEKMWRQSVHLLMSEPAIVIVLRGVNIFNILNPVVSQQQRGSASTTVGVLREGSSVTSNEQRIECIMSHNASQSFAFAHLFFHQNELYPDPLARSLLPFIPEFRFYFNILEKKDNGHKIRVFSLKPIEELNLTQENIIKEMIAGQQPLITLMIIKPTAVKKYLQRIMKKLVLEQFTIVGLRLLVLTPEVADSFILLSNKKDNTSYQKHIESFTSGAVLVIALQQKNAVKRLNDLIGPEDPVRAVRQSQFLWRGEFGRDIYNNGLYCSATYVDAVKDVKLIFTDGVCCEDSDLLALEEICAPAEDSIIDVNARTKRNVTFQCPPHKDSKKHQDTVGDVHHLLLQTICVVLTPQLMKMNIRLKDVPGLDFLAMFLNNGFELVGSRLVWLTQNQAESLLCVLGGGSFEQVTVLCSGPCLVLAMERDNALVSFNSILTQHEDGQQLMQDYGHLVIQPNSITQSHTLLTFFFDCLVPGSHLTITSKLGEGSAEAELPKHSESS